MQLIKDDSYAWDEESKNTYINFYEYSKKYPAIRFSEGSYYVGKKRICTFRYDEKREFLKLKLKNPDKYISEIQKLPEYLQVCFSKKVKNVGAAAALATIQIRVITEYIGNLMM